MGREAAVAAATAVVSAPVVLTRRCAGDGHHQSSRAQVIERERDYER